MTKLIGLFRRRPDVSPEEFRDYYESTHAPFAMSLFGHLFTSYTRNYAAPQAAAGGTSYDVVTEIVFPSAQAREQMFSMTRADPALAAAIAEDEAAFMDRAVSQVLLVDAHVETSMPMRP